MGDASEMRCSWMCGSFKCTRSELCCTCYVLTFAYTLFYISLSSDDNYSEWHAQHDGVTPQDRGVMPLICFSLEKWGTDSNAVFYGKASYHTADCRAQTEDTCRVSLLVRWKSLLCDFRSTSCAVCGTNHAASNAPHKKWNTKSGFVRPLFIQVLVAFKFLATAQINWICLLQSIKSTSVHQM